MSYILTNSSRLNSPDNKKYELIRWVTPTLEMAWNMLPKLIRDNYGVVFSLQSKNSGGYCNEH
jgi:hypothetical protein